MKSLCRYGLKLQLLLFIWLALVAPAFAQTFPTATTSAVTKTTATDRITGDLDFPTGRTLLMESGSTLSLLGVLSGTPTGGTLNLSAVTLTLPTVPVGQGGTGATTLTGLIRGNGTGAFTAAVAGTDFLAPNGNGSALTALNATQLTTGTVPDARFPATLPAASGVNLTALNATNLGSGTVPAARFPALTGEATTPAGAVAVTLTNSAVIGKVLTGYASAAGTVAATDTILGAVGKLNGNTAALANPRAAAQALVFDANSVRAEQTLASAPGVTDHTINGYLLVPTANPATNSNVYHLATSRADATPGEVIIFINTSGALEYLRRGVTAADIRRVATSTSIVSRFGGQAIFWQYAVAAGVLELRINGIVETLAAESTGGTPPAWTAALTGTLGSVGWISAGLVQTQSVLTPPRLLNRALTAAESLAVYQQGAPAALDLPRTPAGSQPAQTNTLGTWTAGSVVGSTYTISTASTGFISAGLVASTLLPACRLRINYTLTINSGPGPQFGDGNLYATAALTGGGIPRTIEFTNPGVGAPLLIVNGFAAGNYVLTINSITVLGCLFAPDPSQPGNGFQRRDISGNRADFTVPAAGASHLLPSDAPNSVRATLSWAGTHEAKSLLGQIALPLNAVVTSIVTTASVGSSGSGLTVGSVTTPALFVAANSYTTARKLHTLATALPAGTAANDLNLVLDPDTAAYTGTIQVAVNYLIAP